MVSVNYLKDPHVWRVQDGRLNWSLLSVQFSRSVVPDSVTPWTVAHQASLPVTDSWTLLKLMSIE